MQTVATIRFTRRNLPHWLVAERPYFVTLRIAGSLPRKLILELQAEREKLLNQSAGDSANLSVMRKEFMMVESVLDAQHHDPYPLTNPASAEILLSSLQWLERDERCWDIYAVTVMGTHMHLVLRNKAGRSHKLLDDLSQFKRQTSREINRISGRMGPLWATECFDHWCRNEQKVVGAVRYTANNPVSAGFCRNWRDWPWTRVQDKWAKLAGL